MNTPKNTVYKIYLLPPAQKALELSTPEAQRRLVAALRTLAVDPRPIEAVKVTDDEGYQAELGNFRVLYRIDEKNRRVYIYKF
jgi:mRNA-degrading endonuclease RelE of RelBE toxin-antitoxin system